MVGNTEDARVGEPKAKIFISYSRKDIEFADRLDAALKTRGFSTLIDRREIYALEDWWKRIEALIVQADTIVFVLSPDSVSSDVCQREVAFAASLNKRLAPIVRRRVEDHATPAALSRLNFIFFTNDALFDEGVAQLAEALVTDIEWIRRHTELGEYARRWDIAGRPGPTGLMLRPPILEQAEAWQTFRPRGTPEPTEAIRAFIATSRTTFEQEQAAQREQVERRLISESRRLAYLAEQQIAAGDCSAAIALALEALPDRASEVKRPYVPGAELALFNACQRVSEIAVLKICERLTISDRPAFVTAAFSPDGRRVLTTSSDGKVQIWDAVSGEEVAAVQAGIPPSQKFLVNMAGAFSPDGARLVTCSRFKSEEKWSDECAIWNTVSGEKIAELLSREIPAVHGRSIMFATFAPDNSPEKPPNSSLWNRVWRGADEHRRRRRVLVGFASSVAQLFDAESGSVLATFTGHSGQITSGAFSADGSKVVTASSDKTARVWDATSGKELAVLKGHQGRVVLATFNAGGTRVLTGSMRGQDDRDNTTRIWDIETGKEIAVLRGHGVIGAAIPFAVSTAMFSPDESRVLTACDDGTARIWDAASGKELLRLQLRELGKTGACFSRDGSRVLTSGGDDASIWDASNGKLITSFKGHDDAVSSAAFSPDESRVLTASDDGTARIWTMNPGAPLVVLQGSEGEFTPRYPLGKAVTRSAFSPDGNRIVTISLSGVSLLWDAATGTRICELAATKQSVIKFSSDGSRVITSSCVKSAPFDIKSDQTDKDLTLTIASAVNGERLGVFAIDDGVILDVAFAPDGARVLVGRSVAAVRIRDNLAGKDISFPPGEERVVARCAGDFRVEFIAHEILPHEGLYGVLSPVGDRICVRKYIWDNSTSKKIALPYTLGDPIIGRDPVTGAEYAMPDNDDIPGADFSPDGTRVIMGTRANRCQICDAATGQQTAVLRAVRLWSPRDQKEYESDPELWVNGIGIRSAEFRPDGARVLTSFSDATARIWDVASGKELATFKKHRHEMTAARFSPDGRRVLTASRDGTARLWDVSSSREIGTLLSHDGRLYDAAFNPDGTRVVIAPETEPACVWQVFPTTQDLVDHAKQLVRRGLTGKEREKYFLDAAPPYWCIEMEKWPYHTPVWKQWLSDSRAGLNPSIPDTPG